MSSSRTKNARIKLNLTVDDILGTPPTNTKAAPSTTATDKKVTDAGTKSVAAPSTPVASTSAAKQNKSLSKAAKNLTKTDFRIICKHVEGMCKAVDDTSDPKEWSWKNFFPAIKMDGSCVYVYRINLMRAHLKELEEKKKKAKKNGSGKLSIVVHTKPAFYYKMVDYSKLRMFFTGEHKRFPEAGKPDDNSFVYVDDKRGKIRFVWWTDYFMEERNKEMESRKTKKETKKVDNAVPKTLGDDTGASTTEEFEEVEEKEKKEPKKARVKKDTALKASEATKVPVNKKESAAVQKRKRDPPTETKKKEEEPKTNKRQKK